MLVVGLEASLSPTTELGLGPLLSALPGLCGCNTGLGKEIGNRWLSSQETQFSYKLLHPSVHSTYLVPRGRVAWEGHKTFFYSKSGAGIVAQQVKLPLAVASNPM